MKKTLVFVTLSALALAAGCGGGASAPDADAPKDQRSTATDPNLRFMPPDQQQAVKAAAEAGK